MKKKGLLIAGIAVGVVLLVVLGGKFAVQNAVMRLEEFEEQVVERYATDGVLHDTSELNAALDEVEDYLAKNKASLLVMSYERTPNSIHVVFLSGFNHVFLPFVEGID